MALTNGPSKKTLSDQTYDFLRERILNDVYPAKRKLPSVRETAETLCVSRNTVERAYQQLLAEGYVRSKEKSGYYVEDFDKDAVPPAGKAFVPREGQPAEDVGQPYVDPGTPYDFCYANPAPASFPIDVWRKLANAVLYSPEAQLVNTYCNPFGDYDLRCELARYLFDSRSVACRPEQVVVQSGIADGFDRLLKLFSPRDDRIAFEDPCLSVARAAIVGNRFETAPLSVASPQRFFDDLERSSAKLVYVTPSHQFPTGFTMPLASRIKLLEWATANDAYIVEDDYDSEFRYKTKAVPSLHALDGDGRVIYTSSFSKTLSPNLRVSYWVLPPELMERYRERMAVFPCPASWLNQRVLYHFLAQGHWERHLRRYLTLNKRKRAALLDACDAAFKGALQLSGTNAGLHVWAKLEGCTSSRELIDAAAAAGVVVYPVDCFYCDAARSEPGAFILGHSKIEEEDIRPGIERLRDAWFR